MCRSIYAYMNADFILILEAAALMNSVGSMNRVWACKLCVVNSNECRV